jgi:hypothetical protein
MTNAGRGSWGDDALPVAGKPTGAFSPEAVAPAVDLDRLNAAAGQNDHKTDGQNPTNPFWIGWQERVALRLSVVTPYWRQNAQIQA